MTKQILSEYKVQYFDVDPSSSLLSYDSFHILAGDNISGKFSDNKYQIFSQYAAWLFSNSNELCQLLQDYYISSLLWAEII